MTKPVRIIPAILTEDPISLNKMLARSVTFTDYVQIDIMDGKFVPSRSITWKHLDQVPANLNWEVHLMVEQPETQLEHYLKAGAQKAIFHFEATGNPRGVVSISRQMGLSIGLAVNPETPVRQILSLTEKVDSVLFLSVHPGFYGAKFIPEVLDKVVELRRQYPHLAIGIDGGMKLDNVEEVATKGVDDICVGSAILTQPDPGEAYARFVELVNRPA